MPDALHDALRTHTQEVVAALASAVEDGKVEVPTEERIQVTHHSAGGMGLTSSDVPKWSGLWFFHSRENLVDATATNQALTAHPEIGRQLGKMIGTQVGAMTVNADRCIQVFLAEYLDRARGLTFRDDVFEALYAELLAFFSSETMQLVARTPLLGFTSDLDRLALEPRVTIMRMTDDDYNEFSSRSHRRGWAPWAWGVESASHLLEVSVTLPKLIMDTGDKLPTATGSNPAVLVDDAVTALRLWQAGWISPADCHVKIKDWSPTGGYGSYGNEPRGPFDSHGYDVGGGTIGACRDFVTVFMAVPKAPWKRLAVAIRRFNDGYARTRLDDRLIDYVIGLEALVLGNDDKTEATFKFGLRGAYLIGDVPAQREQIRQRLKRAYQARSIVVHGGSFEEALKKVKAAEAPAEFIKAIEDDLRTAIRRCILLAQTLGEQKVISAIDAGMLSSNWTPAAGLPPHPIWR